MWQNLVFSVGNVFFSVLNVPLIKENADSHSCHVPYVTSMGLAVVVAIFAVTFATMGMWFSYLTGIITAATW